MVVASRPWMFENFHEAVRYIFSTYVKAKPYRFAGLDRDVRQPWHTRELLDLLGAPDRRLRTIKVTGSKGKGSTARMIAGLLQMHGYRVGLFSSPHLVDFTERIRVNGAAIGEADFMEILAGIRPVVDSLESTFAPHEYLGPVGLVAAVACIYFARLSTDVNVFELGRGARYDDVNRVAGEWAVLTPVLWEHPEQLGPDFLSIVDNKAGVMDAGMRKVIIGRQSQDALRRLRQEAADLRLPVACLGEQFGVSDVGASEDGVRFRLWTADEDYGVQTLSLLGRHQADNAAVAVAAAEAFHGAPLDSGVVGAHFRRLEFPGRCQVLRGDPDVLIDGAINRASARYVREFIAAFGARSVVSVIAVPADKDYVGVLDELACVSDRVIITHAANPHLKFPAAALDIASSRLPSEFAPNLAQAIRLAEERLVPHGLIAIVGTQSLVADALVHYGIDTRDMAEVVQSARVAVD